MSPGGDRVCTTMATELFATGISMGESPRWHDGRLWLCDWVAGEVLAFDDRGAPEVVQRVDGLPFSLEWLPDGRTLLTTPDGVVVKSGDGEPTPYGAGGQGWNEIVVGPAGYVFVNTIGFEFMGGEEPRAGGVTVIASDGEAREVAGDLWFPNGMAVTPDGSTLIVAESYGHCLTAFDIAPDGALSGRRTWAYLGDAAWPDGICLDADGAVWYADVPNQHCVRVREGGEVLDRVSADRGCFACMLGGEDGRTLFIAANQWGGVEGMDDAEPNGVVLTHRAPAAHAGRP